MLLHKVFPFLLLLHDDDDNNFFFFLLSAQRKQTHVVATFGLWAAVLLLGFLFLFLLFFALLAFVTPRSSRVDRIGLQQYTPNAFQMQTQRFGLCRGGGRCRMDALGACRPIHEFRKVTVMITIVLWLLLCILHHHQ